MNELPCTVYNHTHSRSWSSMGPWNMSCAKLRSSWCRDPTKAAQIHRNHLPSNPSKSGSEKYSWWSPAPVDIMYPITGMGTHPRWLFGISEPSTVGRREQHTSQRKRCLSQEWWPSHILCNSSGTSLIPRRNASSIGKVTVTPSTWSKVLTREEMPWRLVG